MQIPETKKPLLLSREGSGSAFFWDGEDDRSTAQGDSQIKLEGLLTAVVLATHLTPTSRAS